MPELPEVETMVRGIRPHVEGRRIERVARCRCACKPILFTPSLRSIAARLKGLRVDAVRRLAKRVVLDVETGASLVFEPRMTGLMLLADPPDQAHLRLEIRFEGAAAYDSVWFWDRRGLGTVRLFAPGELESRFGPDVLGPDAIAASPEVFMARCKATSRPIKVALLDQKFIAGVGNLYASEILHVAGVAPAARTDELTEDAVARVHRAMQDVLTEAIRYEGSTLGDATYRNALNQQGRYQNHHRVYKRAGEECRRCGATIERIVQAQRATFHCPACQR